MLLTIRHNFTLDFSTRTYVMGVLNVTPDSFSDGGVNFSPDKAVQRALKMVEDGADIIDIGGESTRPGAEPLADGEELGRVIPVIKEIRKQSSVPISIDTYKASVALSALDEGADIVNDISGLRADPVMARAVAGRGAAVVLMHMKGTPKDMQKDVHYEALIPEILDCLRESIRMAADAGTAPERIIVDPGIGFGKSYDQNLEILKNLQMFQGLGKPVLAGVSRKAFIGRILGGAPPSDRLEGTLAAVAISVLNGANIVRVHDVKEAAKAVKVADAIKRQRVQEIF